MTTDFERENRYLRDEIERMNYEESQRRDRAFNEREEQRRQRQRDYQEALCYANDWNDAFARALIRLRQEAADEKQMIESGNYPEFNDTFFQDQVEQTVFAEQAYREEMASVQKLIERLEERARNRAASRVEEKYPDAYVAQYLRDDDYSSLVDW